MSESTAIEWCDSTFNPWIGCTRVSPACDDCYAARSTPARTLGVEWGPKKPRWRTSDANWKLPETWNRKADEFEAKHGRRRRVFCASLADVFDNEVPAEWRSDLLHLIVDTPRLDWLLLTKRIGNAHAMLDEAAARNCMPRWGDAMFGNVWIGATVVNQAEADRDVPKLLATPAAVRFLSIEPMLGPISLRWLEAWPENPRGMRAQHPSGRTDHLDGLRRLDWIIAGGESGPHARPAHPDWFRSLRDQCAAAGVQFHFKQWGEWRPIADMQESEFDRLYVSRVKALPHESQEALDDSYGRRCTVPTGVIHSDGSLHGPSEPMSFLVGTGAMQTFKVGKKTGGRLLDGREHNGFPA